MNYFKSNKTFRSSKETSFLGRIYFPSNDRSQNICLLKNVWWFRNKKDKGTDYILS